MLIEVKWEMIKFNIKVSEYKIHGIKIPTIVSLKT